MPLKILFYRIFSREDHSSVKVPHNITTHTAIDTATRTADDGSLFSVEAIKSGCIYECEIDDCESGMLYVGKVIYILGLTHLGGRE